MRRRPMPPDVPVIFGASLVVYGPEPLHAARLTVLYTLSFSSTRTNPSPANPSPTSHTCVPGHHRQHQQLAAGPRVPLDARQVGLDPLNDGSCFPPNHPIIREQSPLLRMAQEARLHQNR